MRPCWMCGKPIEFVGGPGRWIPVEPGQTKRHRCESQDRQSAQNRKLTPKCLALDIATASNARLRLALFGTPMRVPRTKKQTGGDVGPLFGD